MTFRFARHTNNLEKIKFFYSQVLGFQIINQFENHNGYDGVFIGKLNENWHLEFTQSDSLANQTFDEDDILVFYPESKLEYDKIIKSITNHSIELISSKNPYWNKYGKMISDPDGFNIIISNLKINVNELTIRN